MLCLHRLRGAARAEDRHSSTINHPLLYGRCRPSPTIAAPSTPELCSARALAMPRVPSDRPVLTLLCPRMHLPARRRTLAVPRRTNSGRARGHHDRPCPHSPFQLLPAAAAVMFDATSTALLMPATFASCAATSHSPSRCLPPCSAYAYLHLPATVATHA